MRALRWCVGMLGAGLLVAGSTGTARAQITGDSCDGSAVWQDSGLSVDARTVTGVVTIPRSDTVAWEGSVTGPPGAYQGSIWVKLPPPFGEVEIDSWQGDSQMTSNQGVKDYDLPSYVPAGVEFTIGGRHEDANGICEGSVAVVIDGGPWSSPVTWVSLGGTAVTGGAAFALVRPLFRRALTKGMV